MIKTIYNTKIAKEKIMVSQKINQFIDEFNKIAKEKRIIWRAYLFQNEFLHIRRTNPLWGLWEDNFQLCYHSNSDIFTFTDNTYPTSHIEEIKNDHFLKKLPEFEPILKEMTLNIEIIKKVRWDRT